MFRLLAKELISIDREPTLIGRYNQILFDGPPSLMPLIQSQFRLDKNVLKVNFFKIKDFYSYAQEYNKPLESQIKNSHPKVDTALKIAILKAEGN
jgi:ribosomal protein S6